MTYSERLVTPRQEVVTAKGIIVEQFTGGQAERDEVAAHFRLIQTTVEARGQRNFANKDTTQQQLRNLHEIYVPPGGFWVARTLENGRVVGSIGLKDLGHNKGHVGRFGVNPENERQGIGKTLMSTLISHAERSGFKELTLQTGPKQNGLHIYKKFGFVIDGEVDYEGRSPEEEPDHSMSLVLDNY